MLKRGIERFFFIGVVLLFSCSNEKDLAPKIVATSKKTIGEDEYKRIYEQAKDSLEVWSDNSLENYQPVWAFESRLDSILCFNSRKNRMIGAILVRCNRNKCREDDIHYFYGAKVGVRWYFFIGENLVLPRQAYQADTNRPLSFEKIHEIAVRDVFANYLQATDGNQRINDRFFHRMESKNRTMGGYWDCFKCKTFEDYVLYVSIENWKKKAEGWP